MIYLDNAATTKPCYMSLEGFNNASNNLFANPASLYDLGLNAEKAITSCKNKIKSIINCKKEEIYFTSGATESNNLAIIGTAIRNKRIGNKIITTSIEHPSVINSYIHLQKLGFEVIFIKPNDDKNILVGDIIKNIDEKTVLVSTIAVNNETGLILPVAEIAKHIKLKNNKTLYHIDFVQGLLSLPINLNTVPIDLLTISGHKLYSPKGIGVLYKRESVKIDSIMYGGNQQLGIRSGTENTPMIVSLESALEFLFTNRDKILENFNYLKSHLINELSKIVGITLNTHKNSVDNIVNFSVLKIPSEVMLHFLEKKQIYVSSGSACSKNKGSYVLSELGYSKDIIDSAIRVSFSYDTTIEQIDELICGIKEGIEKIYKK